MSKIASIESDTHPCNYLHHLSVLDNKLRYYWIIFEIRLNHRFDDSHRTLDFSFKLLVNQFSVFKILGNQRFANTRYWSHTVQIFRQTNFVLNILKRLFGKPKINNEVSILSHNLYYLVVGAISMLQHYSKIWRFKTNGYCKFMLCLLNPYHANGPFLYPL